MYEMLTTIILFTWKKSITHTKFYVYHPSLITSKGPAIPKSSKMKLFNIIVGALKALLLQLNSRVQGKYLTIKL